MSSSDRYILEFQLQMGPAIDAARLLNKQLEQVEKRVKGIGEKVNINIDASKIKTSFKEVLDTLNITKNINAKFTKTQIKTAFSEATDSLVLTKKVDVKFNKTQIKTSITEALNSISITKNIPINITIASKKEIEDNLSSKKISLDKVSIKNLEVSEDVLAKLNKRISDSIKIVVSDIPLNSANTRKKPGHDAYGGLYPTGRGKPYDIYDIQSVRPASKSASFDIAINSFLREISKMVSQTGGRSPKIYEFGPQLAQHPQYQGTYSENKEAFQQGRRLGVTMPGNQIFTTRGILQGRNAPLSSSVINHELMHTLYSSIGSSLGHVGSSFGSTYGDNPENIIFKKLGPRAAASVATAGIPYFVNRQKNFLSSIAKMTHNKSVSDKLQNMMPSDVKSHVNEKNQEALLRGMEEYVVSIAGLVSTASNVESGIKAGKIGKDSEIATPVGKFTASEVVKLGKLLSTGTKDPNTMAGQGRVMGNLVSQLTGPNMNPLVSKTLSGFNLGEHFVGNAPGMENLSAEDKEKLIQSLKRSQNPMLATVAESYSTKFKVADIFGVGNLGKKKKYIEEKLAKGDPEDLFAPITDVLNKGFKQNDLSSMRDNVAKIDKTIERYKAMAEVIDLLGKQTKEFILEVAKSVPAIDKAIKRHSDSPRSKRSIEHFADQTALQNIIKDMSNDIDPVLKDLSKLRSTQRKQDAASRMTAAIEGIEAKISQGQIPEQHQFLQALTGMTMKQARSKIAEGKLSRQSVAGYIVEHGITASQVSKLIEDQTELRDEGGRKKALSYIKKQAKEAEVRDSRGNFTGYETEEKYIERQLEYQRRKLDEKVRIARETGTASDYRTTVKSRSGSALIDETLHIDKTGNITGSTQEGLKKGLLSIQGINGELNQAIHKVINWALATGAVYSVLRGFRAAQEAVINFNKELTTLKSIMQPTNEQLSEMSDSAVNIGVNYGQSIKEVMSSMTDFAKQGLKQKEIIEATEASMLLANISMISAQDAGKAVITVMKQMKIPFAEAIGVIDKLTAVDAAFAVTLEDLTKGLGRTGSSAKTFGMDLDHIIAAIATVGEATQRSGKEVGTALRTSFARGVSGQSIKLFESLGIQVKDAQGNLNSFQNIIDSIGQSWDQFSQTQKLAVGEALGGKMRLNEMLSLFDNYDNYLKAIIVSENSAGSAKRRNEVIMASLAKQMQVTKSSIEGLVIALGDKGLLFVLKAIQVAIQGVTSGLMTLDKISGGVSSAALSTALLGGGGLAAAGTIAQTMGFYGINPRVTTPKIATANAATLAATAEGKAASLFMQNQSPLAGGAAKSFAAQAAGSAAAGALAGGEQKAASSLVNRGMQKFFNQSAVGQGISGFVGASFIQKFTAFADMASWAAKMTAAIGVGVAVLSVLHRSWKYLAATSEDLAKSQDETINESRDYQSSMRNLAINSKILNVDSEGKFSATGGNGQEIMSEAMQDERLRKYITRSVKNGKVELGFAGMTDANDIAKIMNAQSNRIDLGKNQALLKQINTYGAYDSAGFLNSRYMARSVASGFDHRTTPIMEGGARFMSGYARDALANLLPGGDLNEYSRLKNEQIEPQLRAITEKFAQILKGGNITSVMGSKDYQSAIEIAGNLYAAKSGITGVSNRSDFRKMGSNYLTQFAVGSTGNDLFEDSDISKGLDVKKFANKSSTGEIISVNKQLVAAYGHVQSAQDGSIKKLETLDQLTNKLSKGSVIFKHGLDGQIESTLYVDRVTKDSILTYDSFSGKVVELTQKDLPALSIALDKVTNSMGSQLTTLDELKTSLEAIKNASEIYQKIQEVAGGHGSTKFGQMDKNKSLAGGFESQQDFRKRMALTQERTEAMSDAASHGTGISRIANVEKFTAINELLSSGRTSVDGLSQLGISANKINLGGGQAEIANLGMVFDKVNREGAKGNEEAIKKALIEGTKVAYGYSQMGEALKNKEFVKNNPVMEASIDNRVKATVTSLALNMRLLSDVALGRSKKGEKYSDDAISGSVGQGLIGLGLTPAEFAKMGMKDAFGYIKNFKPIDETINSLSPSGRSNVRNSTVLAEDLMKNMEEARRAAEDKGNSLTKAIEEDFSKISTAVGEKIAAILENAKVSSSTDYIQKSRSMAGVYGQLGLEYEKSPVAPMHEMARGINTAIEDSLKMGVFSKEFVATMIEAANSGLKFNEVLSKIASNFIDGAAAGLNYGGSLGMSTASEQSQLMLSQFKTGAAELSKTIFETERLQKEAGGPGKNAEIDQELEMQKGKYREFDRFMGKNLREASGVSLQEDLFKLEKSGSYKEMADVKMAYQLLTTSIDASRATGQVGAIPKAQYDNIEKLKGSSNAISMLISQRDFMLNAQGGFGDALARKNIGIGETLKEKFGLNVMESKLIKSDLIQVGKLIVSGQETYEGYRKEADRDPDLSGQNSVSTSVNTAVENAATLQSTIQEIQTRISEYELTRKQKTDILPQGAQADIYNEHIATINDAFDRAKKLAEGNTTATALIEEQRASFNAIPTVGIKSGQEEYYQANSKDMAGAGIGTQYQIASDLTSVITRLGSLLDALAAKNGVAQPAGNAPAMHTGGLASSEFMAVLQRGEAVIPRNLVPKLPLGVLRSLPRFHTGNLDELSFMDAKRVGESFVNYSSSDPMLGIKEEVRRLSDVIDKFFNTASTQNSANTTNDSLSLAVEALAQISAKLENQNSSPLVSAITSLVETLSRKSDTSQTAESGEEIRNLEIHHTGIPQERTVNVKIDRLSNDAMANIAISLASDPAFIESVMSAMANKPLNGV